MFGIQDLAWFVLAGALLNVTPGPDTLLVVTRSASQGWRAGSAAALGIGAGTFVHIFAAALGLSALLATSALAFALVKYAGAAYLLYVGVKMLLAKDEPGRAATAATLPQVGYARIFVQGFVTNALNPKVAVFFLAFVPQFIAPESPTKAAAFIVLGIIFNISNMLWCHSLAFSTALFRRQVRVRASVTRWLNRAVGALFVSFGVRLALSER